MIDIITGTAFDAPKRMHHAEDEPALEFPSGAGSRRRALNALKAQNWKATKKSGPTARDYVQDGLVAMWDGIENARFGVHDANATSWVDLVGGHDLTLYGVGTRASWGNDSLTCLPANGWAAYRTGDVISPAYVEAMFISTMQNGDYSSVFSCGGSVNHVSIVATKELQTVSGFSATIGTTWHGMILHISSDQSTHAMKLNGVNASIRGGNSFSGASHLAVGGRNSGEGLARRFDGRLYFVRLYSRALTADEIAANYAVDKARFGLA